MIFIDWESHSFHWKELASFLKIIVIVSVVRAEIACNKLLIDLL